MQALQAFEEGRWYQCFTATGFTIYGKYVGPLGMDRHRFAPAFYQRNAGGVWLTELALNGPAKDTRLSPTPWPEWTGIVLDWTPCHQEKWETWAAQQKHR